MSRSGDSMGMPSGRLGWSSNSAPSAFIQRRVAADRSAMARLRSGRAVPREFSMIAAWMVSGGASGLL